MKLIHLRIPGIAFIGSIQTTQMLSWCATLTAFWWGRPSIRPKEAER